MIFHAEASYQLIGGVEWGSSKVILGTVHVIMEDHLGWIYRKVFSFRFLSLVLVIWSRNRSLNILRSGLWSTAMVRFLHLRTKCLALSRASATASASPSTGAYLDSAACVNLLPTREIFQPCF